MMILNKLKIPGAVRRTILSCLTVVGLISIIALAGCNSDGSSSTETGTLSISMGDSVADVYQVWVTIAEVSVHKSVDEENEGEEQDNGPNEGEDTGYWEVLEDAKVGTYNLRSLINGQLVELVTGNLEAAHYTQIRLLLGDEPTKENFPEDHEPLGGIHPYANYVVTSPPPEGAESLDDNLVVELQIGSGFQTGIKLVKGFDIEAGVVTELIFDWNLDNSIIEMGNGGYRLNPTIKILDAVVASTLSGTVTDNSGEPIEGATVTAFGDTNDETGEVSVSDDAVATFTDSEGAYMLILEAGTYDVVATAGDKCDEIIGLEIGVATDNTEDGDFSLIDCSSQQ